MGTTTPSELELLSAWCEGSDQAGDRLLRRCFPLLYRFFINKVGDATDDLVQQTLIACTKHRDKILDSGAFRMYLFKIARSRLFDHLRAARRRAGHVDDDFEQVSIAQTGISFASRLGRAQAATAVRTALQTLPVELQLVVEMHYWEDASTGEIAEATATPQGTVKSRLRRARALLTAHLGRDDEEVAALVGAARPVIDVGGS